MPSDTAQVSMPTEEQLLGFEDFSRLIGQYFEVHLDDGRQRSLKLVHATAKDHVDGRAGEPSQFTVVFHEADASVQEHLPQQTYRLKHATVGAMDVFVVPVGAGENGVGIEYEAVFNRMHD